MLRQHICMIKKVMILAMMVMVASLFTACGQMQVKEQGRKPDISQETGQDTENQKSRGRQRLEDFFDDEVTGSAETGAGESPVSVKETIRGELLDDMQKQYGRNCISEQTFEVELSEYSDAVYFVPFAPVEGKGDSEGQTYSNAKADQNADFHMQIIQDGEVLANIRAYVPEELKGETFTSLDAVSFFDVNYDGLTDIVLIETYGSTSFAAVYYAYADYDDADRYFFHAEGHLSDQISEQILEQGRVLTVSEIRSLLSDGKRNGEFTSYQEAYYAVSRLCELEGAKGYDLIYFDEDDIPELVAGVSGYYTSLYTYSNGKVYLVMDRWAYGAGGNTGYYYVPKKNSLRNWDQDGAGAILYTTYMTISKQHTMDVVVTIVLYNFDDANGNGSMDKDEEDSLGYGKLYIDGKEVTDEECEIYEKGEYEFIGTEMSLRELRSNLTGN